MEPGQGGGEPQPRRRLCSDPDRGGREGGVRAAPPNPQPPAFLRGSLLEEKTQRKIEGIKKKNGNKSNSSVGVVEGSGDPSLRSAARRGAAAPAEPPQIPEKKKNRKKKKLKVKKFTKKKKIKNWKNQKIKDV